jgi:hypothetical protein
MSARRAISNSAYRGAKTYTLCHTSNPLKNPVNFSATRDKIERVHRQIGKGSKGGTNSKVVGTSIEFVMPR